MKAIRCRDVGVDCDFEARGATAEEVLAKCAEHARADHGMEQIQPEIVEKVNAAMREESASGADKHPNGEAAPR